MGVCQKKASLNLPHTWWEQIQFPKCCILLTVNTWQWIKLQNSQILIAMHHHHNPTESNWQYSIHPHNAITQLRNHLTPPSSSQSLETVYISRHGQVYKVDVQWVQSHQIPDSGDRNDSWKVGFFWPPNAAEDPNEFH
jgi:hypothetical protein